MAPRCCLSLSVRGLTSHKNSNRRETSRLNFETAAVNLIKNVDPSKTPSRSHPSYSQLMLPSPLLMRQAPQIHLSLQQHLQLLIQGRWTPFRNPKKLTVTPENMEHVKRISTVADTLYTTKMSIWSMWQACVQIQC